MVLQSILSELICSGVCVISEYIALVVPEKIIFIYFSNVIDMLCWVSWFPVTMNIMILVKIQIRSITTSYFDVCFHYIALEF